MEIQGKNAIVVGGASGMALASVKELMSKGAGAAILDLPTSNGEAVAKELGITFHPCNVMDAEETEKALNDAYDALGSVHIAINTAGGGIAKKTLGKEGPHDLESFRGVVELNLIGTFNLNRLQAELMSRNDIEQEDDERGVIINTASIAAFEGQIGQVAYSASKGGIVGMTLPMARDLADKGIRVCAIAPGIFATPMMDGMPQEVQDALGAQVPFPRRLGQGAEYANLVGHIIDNQMLNGEVIRLDGAIRMAPR